MILSFKNAGQIERRAHRVFLGIQKNGREIKEQLFKFVPPAKTWACENRNGNGSQYVASLCTKLMQSRFCSRTLNAFRLFLDRQFKLNIQRQKCTYNQTQSPPNDSFEQRNWATFAPQSSNTEYNRSYSLAVVQFDAIWPFKANESFGSRKVALKAIY